MKKFQLAWWILGLSATVFGLVNAVQALEVPTSALASTVVVQCENQYGSGFISKITPTATYVLTVGHVATRADNSIISQCDIGLPTDASYRPRAWYRARLIKSIFDKKTDRDVAVFQLGFQFGGPTFRPSTFIASNEFAAVGDAVTVLGYPGASDAVVPTHGTITGFRRGSVLTNAKISPGDSGGPLVDSNGYVVGIAVRVLLTGSTSGASNATDYEMVDILDAINWLDLAGRSSHDAYITHAPGSNFDTLPFLIRTESPPCLSTARSLAWPTVYCVFPGSLRFVFPNTKTFFSWYSDFTGVSYADQTDLNTYKLVGNMTYKAGTLIKITTDPKVYVVTDSLGTIHWLESEAVASRLFGLNWTKLVVDVPDAFFTDYTVGPSVQ